MRKHRRAHSGMPAQAGEYAGLYLKVAAVIVVFGLVLGLLVHTGSAQAADDKTLMDVYGVSRSEVVSWLESHEHDDYYLGTPYKPYDWRSPNGDINGWGANSDGTSAGMNCTGFVWHALCAAHGWRDDIANRLPAMSGWVDAIRDNGFLTYTYESKSALLTSGVLEKGDIVWMWENGDRNLVSDHHHVGIFWGDTPSQDVFWHSEGNEANGWSGLNAQSDIHGKADQVSYEVVKLGGSLNGALRLTKTSAVPSLTDGNALYSLGGAVYGLFETGQLAQTNNAARALASYTTDSRGTFETGMDIRTGTYYVAECAAPQGYRMNTTIYKVKVSAGKTADVNAQCGSIEDDPDDVPVEDVVHKDDAQISGVGAQGAASLAGALFEVLYFNGYYDAASLPAHATRTWTVRTNDQGIAQLNESCIVSGDALYRDAAGNIVFPLGTVAIRELQAPEGYLSAGPLADGGAWRIVKITPEGAVAAGGSGACATFCAPTIADEVIRGDFSFTKVNGQTGEHLAGVAFSITSCTTGEAHVIATDDNGMASTAAAWNSHARSTNANDYLLEEPALGEEDTRPAADATAGIWFSGHAQNSCAPDDRLGALPYDTYRVQELKSAANESLSLVQFTVRITRDGAVLDLGTVDDNAGPFVDTTLADANGVKLVAPESDAKVSDTVGFTNLDPGKDYTVAGELHRVTEEGEDGGIVAEGSTDFTAHFPTGTVQVDFEFDANQMEGARLVAFERLMNAQGTTLAVHDDLMYEGQTVRVPAIGTTLLDEASITHNAQATGEIALCDRVTYEGLTPGESYVLVGTLHVRGDDGLDAGIAEDTKGRQIIVRKNFTAAESTGATDVEFIFEAPELAGKTLVCFEELVKGDAVYATHADIASQDQSVSLAALPTESAAEKPQAAEPDYTPDKLPQTADSAPILPFAILGACALGVLIALGIPTGALRVRGVLRIDRLLRRPHHR